MTDQVITLLWLGFVLLVSGSAILATTSHLLDYKRYSMPKTLAITSPLWAFWLIILYVFLTY